MEKSIILIDNLKCSGCEGSITKALKKIEGVSMVKIDAENDTIEIEHRPSVAREKLVAQLKQLGYPEQGSVSGVDALLTEAKSYVSCAIGKMTAG
jgi:copper chaperone